MTALSDTFASYLERISTASGTDALDGLEQELFGRKGGLLTLALKELGGLPPEERTKRGQELNAVKEKFVEALAARRRELEQSSFASIAETDKLDPTLELPPSEHGHLHLIPEFLRHVEEVFGRMGFVVAEGPEIETEDLNFNLLNIPEHHPARDTQDTFWITAKDRRTTPDKNLVLRTQTSSIQIRYGQAHKPPFRIIYFGKTYRNDTDATHSPMFHQFEAMMVGKNLSLANMKAVMTTAIRELTVSDAEFRFRSSFFPFVEPGLEVDMRWRGDESASREGKWLEIAGCGMVHPNVLRNCNIDPAEWQGFAFAFGVERMIMIKHQIPDLRSFYHGDLRFLRQF